MRARRGTDAIANVDAMTVARAIKLGTLPRLARALGFPEAALVAEARRQYAARLDNAQPPHLRANLAGLVAALDACPPT